MPLAVANIHVAPFRDIALMDSTIRREDVWEAISDDTTPDNFSMRDLVADPHNVFFGVWKDGAYCGFFGFYHKTEFEGVYEMHTAMHKECRGQCALTAGWKAVDWLFMNTGCRGVITRVLDANPAMRMMMAVAKWKRVAEKICYAIRNGQPCSGSIYALNREDWSNLYFA